MSVQLESLTSRSSWQDLAQHYDGMRDIQLRDLFAKDADRGSRLTAEACGIFLDFSKNRITDETLQLLVGLAEDIGLRDKIEDMFTGKRINVTEDRSVLHIALRTPKTESIVVDGEDVVRSEAERAEAPLHHLPLELIRLSPI